MHRLHRVNVAILWRLSGDSYPKHGDLLAQSIRPSHSLSTDSYLWREAWPAIDD